MIVITITKTRTYIMEDDCDDLADVIWENYDKPNRKIKQRLVDAGCNEDVTVVTEIETEMETKMEKK